MDYLAKHLTVTYTIADTRSELMRATVTLTNSGSIPIASSKWTIYLFHFTAAKLARGCFTLSHLDGREYSLAPSACFKGVQPGQSVKLTLYSGRIVARYYFMPNWYVVADQAAPRVLASTTADNISYVSPSTSPYQYKRGKKDKTHPWSPRERYDLYSKITDLGHAPNIIIPSPESITVSWNDSFYMEPHSWRVLTSSAELQELAKYMAGM